MVYKKNMCINTLTVSCRLHVVYAGQQCLYDFKWSNQALYQYSKHEFHMCFSIPAWFHMCFSIPAWDKH